MELFFNSKCFQSSRKKFSDMSFEKSASQLQTEPGQQNLFLQLWKRTSTQKWKSGVTCSFSQIARNRYRQKDWQRQRLTTHRGCVILTMTRDAFRVSIVNGKDIQLEIVRISRLVSKESNKSRNCRSVGTVEIQVTLPANVPKDRAAFAAQWDTTPRYASYFIPRALKGHLLLRRAIQRVRNLKQRYHGSQPAPSKTLSFPHRWNKQPRTSKQSCA